MVPNQGKIIFITKKWTLLTLYWVDISTYREKPSYFYRKRVNLV